MTSPDLYQPGQPGRLEDMKPTIGGLASIMLSNVGTIAQNIFRGIADAVGGLFKGQDGPLGEISDGQLSLMDRQDLLDGLRGFCSAYQSVNVNGEWDIFGNGRRVLPYSEPLTASKGAHVDADKGGIVFDEPGAWMVWCYAHARATVFTGNNLSAIYVDIIGPSGDIVRHFTFDIFTGAEYGTVGGSFPVLIPEPGCWIRVTAWSGRWRWWDGGTRYALQAVMKQDSRLEHGGQETVPDEEKP